MILSLNNLSFAYGRTPALSNITVRAEPGRIVAVVGPNAAGKSTLLRCILGVLRPARGEATLDGAAVHRLPARSLAQRIAYVSQRATVSAAFTVKQVVELGRYALPADTQRVREAIERLDLRDIQQRPYRALSVGQQQRVTMARALAQLAPGGALFLDEPTSAMDLLHVNACHRLLRDAARAGAIVILATHDLTVAAATADDVWLLDRGRLMAAGPAREVLEVQRLREVFGVNFAWVDDHAGRPRLLAELPASA
jgi:iron complex transport system ATP-binding protein